MNELLACMRNLVRNEDKSGSGPNYYPFELADFEHMRPVRQVLRLAPGRGFGIFWAGDDSD